MWFFVTVKFLKVIIIKTTQLFDTHAILKEAELLLWEVRNYKKKKLYIGLFIRNKLPLQNFFISSLSIQQSRKK